MKKKAFAVPLVLLAILLAGGAFAYFNRKTIGQKADLVKKYGARAVFSNPEDIITTASVTSTPSPAATPTASPTPAIASSANSTSALPSITTLSTTVTATPIATPTPQIVSAPSLPVSGPEDSSFIMLGISAVLAGSAAYYGLLKNRLRNAHRSIQIL